MDIPNETSNAKTIAYANIDNNTKHIGLYWYSRHTLFADRVVMQLFKD